MQATFCDEGVKFTRTDLAQAAVAAAIEAAAQVCDSGNAGAFWGKAIRALATPDQIAALAAERAKLDKAAEALQGLVRYQKSILADVLTAHSNRGAGASEWMREDDRDFMRDLRAAFEVSAAVLAEIGGA